MSGRPLREEGPHPVPALRRTLRRLGDGFDHFRQTRLFTQIVLTVLLFALTAGSRLIASGPLGRAGAGLRRAVTQDYDFRGRALSAGTWVREQGGLGAVTRALLLRGRTLLGEWIPLSDQTGAARTAPGAGTSTATDLAVRMPVPSRHLPVDGALLTGFGWVGEGRSEWLHEGLDLMADTGAAVTAMTDGQVLAHGTDPRLGGFVEVDHGPVIAVYAQVSGVGVPVGAHVRGGQRLAEVAAPVGDEKALPPHLHLEIRTRQGRVPIDPGSFLGLGGKKL